MKKQIVDETLLFVLMQYNKMKIVKHYYKAKDELICNTCGGHPDDGMWRKLIIQIPNVDNGVQEFSFCDDECVDAIRNNKDAARIIVLSTLETMELLHLADTEERKKKPNKALMQMINKAKKQYGEVDDPAGLLAMAMEKAKKGETQFELKNLKK